jgi:hypothetical protein
MKVNKVNSNIQFDLDNFFNSETGESLASEIVGNNISVTIKKETDLITLKKPENFSMINLDTLNKLYKILSNSDLGYLLKMFPLTKTEMNLIYNNTIPHSNSTLQKYLEIKSNKTFHTLIKRLISAGVLYQIKGNIQGAVRVVYIMNPNVSNRRKTFHNSLVNLFKDFNY